MSRVSSLPHQSGNVGKRLPEGHEEDFCCYNYYLLLCPISINFEECFYFGPLCFLAPGKKNPAPESTMDQNRKILQNSSKLVVARDEATKEIVHEHISYFREKIADSEMMMKTLKYIFFDFSMMLMLIGAPGTCSRC